MQLLFNEIAKFHFYKKDIQCVFHLININGLTSVIVNTFEKCYLSATAPTGLVQYCFQIMTAMNEISMILNRIYAITT